MTTAEFEAGSDAVEEYVATALSVPSGPKQYSVGTPEVVWL